MKRRVGRIHILEAELSKLLGYEGGRIIYIDFMPESLEIGIGIEHPEMSIIEDGSMIPRVERR